jgi:hypothetical protein
MTFSFVSAGDVTGGCATSAAAAVLREIRQERIHPFVVRGVDELSTPPLLVDEPRVRQLNQMERKRGSGNLQSLGDRASGKPLGPLLDEKPVHGEPRFLCEGAEPGDDLGEFHPPTLLRESKARVNDLSRNVE